VHTKEEKVA